MAGGTPVALSDLLKADLLRPGQTLHFRDTGTTGEVTPEGSIRIDNSVYASPSTAAKAAANGTSTNGWLAWSVDEGGQRVLLADLRARLSA